jgi:2-amino-4-hydroxy-6-hydroxymethyldihydropteridine diphosphokinase
LACIGLGSNIGNRATYLASAVNAIKHLGDPIALSAVYESEPFGVDEKQPIYLNMVIAIRTQLSPMALLSALLEVERASGRIRNRRNEARTLDLDLLMMDDEMLETADIVLPHPRMHERAFVMLPLAEIRPDLSHPIQKLTMSQIADGLPNQGVRRIGSINELTGQTVVKIPAPKPV